MARPIELGVREARAVHLAAQGLLAPPRRPATREDVLLAVRRMQLLQIDTIHVVARSPYLVLFSRLGPYEPRWLDELLEARALFECWAHEACFAPIAVRESPRTPPSLSFPARRRASDTWSDSAAARLRCMTLSLGPVWPCTVAERSGW